jgi:hypothetical protein
MNSENCIGFLCFIALDSHGDKFFGFAEFLAGLALMVLAWTLADVRYKFRIDVAPLPLKKITFCVVAFTGFATLLTDLWRAESWYVPAGEFITPAIWQAILGAGFLLTFLVWAWYAFISPPIYGPRNCHSYARALYRAILNGAETELDVITDEIGDSAMSLISFATEYSRFPPDAPVADSEADFPIVSKLANEILMLMGDKRFCRSMVRHSTRTALIIFSEIEKQKKYRLRIHSFAQNFSSEAVSYRDSFLYHETSGYESGLIGYIKPLTSAIYSNYALVEVQDDLLDMDFRTQEDWDAAQWGAYCRIVLMAFADYIERGWGGHSVVLHRARGRIGNIANELYKLDGIGELSYRDGINEKLRLVLSFISDSVELMKDKNLPSNFQLKQAKPRNLRNETIYDHLAQMIFEVICQASQVRSPRGTCWWIQHNTVWTHFFGSMNHMNSDAGKIIKYKVRRLIYDEVTDLLKFHNFRAARLLGLCLNVMGLNLNTRSKNRDFFALHATLLSLTKKHFSKLHTTNPTLAAECLVTDITFDQIHLQLVKTYPTYSGVGAPSTVTFTVDP